MTSPPINFPPDQIPLLARRYSSTAIDGLVLLLFFLVAGSIPGDSELALFLRRILMFAPILMYEPFLTASGATLGQYIMGIRVRRLEDPTRRISLGAAYGRYIMKIFLGMFSFVLAFFTKYRMTIHDKFADSIVLNANSYLLKTE